MRKVSDSGHAPLFLYELAHSARHKLENPAVRESVVSKVREVITRQREESGADAEIRSNNQTAQWKWHQGGCAGPQPQSVPPQYNTELGVYVDEWPLPVELGIEEAPGCIFALAALNEYAVEHPDVFNRLDCTFKSIWPKMPAIKPSSAKCEPTEIEADATEPVELALVRPAFTFYLHWTRHVDDFQPHHALRLGEVIRKAIDQLGRGMDQEEGVSRLCRPPSHLPSQLVAEMRISERTLNRYAKMAGVATPGRGQRNYRYSDGDRLKILRAVCEQCSDSAIVANCKRLADEYGHGKAEPTPTPNRN